MTETYMLKHTEYTFQNVVSWGAGIKTKDANRMNKLIKKAGSVVGSELVDPGGGGGQDAGETAGDSGQSLSPPPQN